MKERPFALIGVHMAIEGEDARKVKEVMTKHELNWRTFVDRGPIVEKWKPVGTPTFFLIDHKGVIRRKWPGAPGEKRLHAAVKGLVEEAEKDAKKTK